MPDHKTLLSSCTRQTTKGLEASDLYCTFQLWNTGNVSIIVIDKTKPLKKHLHWWFDLGLATPPVTILHNDDKSTASEDVMQNMSNKLVSLLTVRKWLCQQVVLILMCVHISNSPFIPGRALTDEMVSNALRLLLELRFRDTCVSQHRLVVSKQVRWTMNGNTHHPQLVSQSSKVFAA